MDPNRDDEEGGSTYSYTPGLHVCIGIPGWLGKSGSRPGSCAAVFASDFEALLPCSERFALRWESKRLKQMGRAFAKFWASKTAQTLAQQAVTQLGGVFSLIAGAFLAAIAWPLTVVSVMDYIDNVSGISFCMPAFIHLVMVDISPGRNLFHEPMEQAIL